MWQNMFLKVNSWLEVVMDLVVVNLLWLICCIPVVTIGPATTALHYVARKIAAGESCKVWADFWKSFRQNWKQGMVLGLLLGLGAALGAADIVIGLRTEGMPGTVILVLGVAGMILVLSLITFAFPLLARYTQTLPGLLKNALLLSIGYFWIMPIGCAAAVFFPVLVWWNIGFANLAVPIWVLAGASLTALVVQLLMGPVYRRLEAPRTEEE